MLIQYNMQSQYNSWSHYKSMSSGFREDWECPGVGEPRQKFLPEEAFQPVSLGSLFKQKGIDIKKSQQPVTFLLFDYFIMSFGQIWGSIVFFPWKCSFLPNLHFRACPKPASRILSYVNRAISFVKPPPHVYICIYPHIYVHIHEILLDSSSSLCPEMIMKKCSK